MSPPLKIDRRAWLKAAAAPLALSALGTQAADNSSAVSLCAFEKFIQRLSCRELADALAEIGFAGVEATVRRGGRIEPEKVEDELPRLVEALGKRDLEVAIATTDVLDADDPAGRKVLETCAAYGIRRYRMSHYRYDRRRDIPAQLAELKPKFAALAELNRELGLVGLYQNHSGFGFVGATVWDLYELIKDLPPGNLAMAFDIRHATVEAGLSWDVLYQLMRPQIGAVFVKDFRWQGRVAENAPLGSSIDPAFFRLLRQDAFSGPVSLHVEYLPDAGVAENLQALRRDYALLAKWLAA
ncbi:MAG: sugar phosphate isomerase/epimerase [Pirellulales bacterium]|nr:sugar phosphate isomerase/epimerase [Pirellulales bacterium]